jgi:hypothetical protein
MGSEPILRNAAILSTKLTYMLTNLEPRIQQRLGLFMSEIIEFSDFSRQ